MERTPDEVLTNAPFPIAFGDEVFKIKRLPIAKARAWRRQVIEHDKNLTSLFPEDDASDRVAALSDRTPDLILSLVRSYLEVQTGDKITPEQLENATDLQLMEAYQKLLEASFPNGLLSAGTSVLAQVLR